MVTWYLRSTRLPPESSLEQEYLTSPDSVEYVEAFTVHCEAPELEPFSMLDEMIKPIGRIHKQWHHRKDYWTPEER